MQTLDALAPVLGVVKPAEQFWHGGVALDALPPADQVPTGQASHLAPPLPGRQTADGVSGLFRAQSCIGHGCNREALEAHGAGTLGCSPLQAPEELAPVAPVVKGATHAVQLGFATVALPPADHEPTAHAEQRGPPKPATQTGGCAGRDGRVTRSRARY